MAKKNWRNSDAPRDQPRTDRSGWAGSSESKGLGSAGRALVLLISAGILGGLIALYGRLIPPEISTPLVFCDSYPASQGESILSSNAFAQETENLLINETNDDLAATLANFRSIQDVEVTANGPDRNVVLFYVYGDIFLTEAGEPCLLSHDRRTGQAWDGNAVQASTNAELREFLEKVCRLDVGPESENGNQRIVVLDCGRLDSGAFSSVAPEPIAESVESVIRILRDSKVPNSDRLWVLLATDDYQLGWTSPELNGSVFAYFFSQGLRGQADRDGNRIVSLGELSAYVRESVARWVENYRDAIQTPRLLCGGDLDNADDIQLVHHQSRQPKPISGLNQNSLHDELWNQAYSVRQPHRRQIACSGLVRLEQLRYCQPKEYTQLTNKVKTLLKDASETFQLDHRQSTSVFDELVDSGINAAAIADLRDYLKPQAVKHPAAGVQETNIGDRDNNQTPEAAGDSANEPDQEDPAKRKTPGRAIMHLDSLQRLALVWHFLVHKRSGNDVFGQPQLNESLGFIRHDDASNRECDDLAEMQFLVLLNDNLPWQANGFDESVFHGAVRCFDASESLMQGCLGSYSDDVQPQRLNEAWLNWRHIGAEFEQLETRRRFALDQAIAGQSQSSSLEFSLLLKDYRGLSDELADMIEARNNAENLLFALPYLRSFALRDSLYRKHAESGESDFCLPLTELASLEKMANGMILLVTGPAMPVDSRKRLKRLDEESGQIAGQIRGVLGRIASDTAQSQSASKYVFDAQNLLMTPLPEWIDQASKVSASTRYDILDQLGSRLAEQQKMYFDSVGSDDPIDALDLDSIAINFRESSVRKLAEFKKVLTQTVPVESLVPETEMNISWSEVQSFVTTLPTVEQLKNPDPDNGAFAIPDGSVLTSELLRLDKIDQNIRSSGRSIGLAKSVADIDQQRARLTQFDVQRRMLNRAICDFWGAGDVAKRTETPPPFVRRVNAHARNLQLISESMTDFRLEGGNYRAYDPESLSVIGKGLQKLSADLWAEVSGLLAVWRLDDQTIRDRQIVVEDSTGSNWLAIGIDRLEAVLAMPEYFPLIDEASSHLTGQRISLERRAYFSSFEIPASVRNSKAWGTALFRGHQFRNDLGISRKFTVEKPRQTFVFQPKFHANEESLITVSNDVNNEVDLIFLFDCSNSMATDDKLKTVKNTAHEIMLELAREKRFHIGLAAFGHRGEFTNEKVNGKLVKDRTGKYPFNGRHPFDDWEILSRPPRDVSDEQQVDDLWDLHLSALKPRGFTPLYFSISQTLAYFSNPTRKNILIVVTDGEDFQGPDDEAAVPKDLDGNIKQRTKKEDLEEEYRQKYEGKAEVFVLQIDSGIVNKMPAAFKAVTLGPNTAQEMKARIFDAVGRYQFSVVEKGKSPTPDDLRPMGQTIILKNIHAEIDFVIRTHGVPTGSSEREVVLSGGEEYLFVNSNEGLRLDRSDATQTVEDYLGPKIEKSIAIGSESYEVGRLRSNQSNNVRIGFANKRGMSQYPGRVWARVRDDQEREFDMVRPTKEFFRVPTYNFEMPDGLRAKSVNMTLFVSPDRAAGKPLNAAEDQVKTMVEMTGEGSGEFRGINYIIKQNPGSPTRFSVTLTSPQSLTQAFALECPNSVPFGSDQTMVIHSVTFEGVNRVQEVIEFEIPEGRAPTFRLYAQPKEKMEAALKDRPPAQDFKTGVDPIFGDPVIVIQFEGIQLRN